MANPKRRFGKARTRQRRSIAMKITTTRGSKCKRCNQAKLPHRICPNCGHYNDREVISAA